MAILKVVNSKRTSHAAMNNAINYVLQEEKTNKELCDISGDYEFEEVTRQNVYQSFLNLKNDFDKDRGRMYEHFVISFHKDEAITKEQAFDFGMEYAAKKFPYNQTLVAVHQDKDHLHIHLIVNTVNFIDGKKLRQSRDDLAKDKQLVNEMCRERGLHVAEKGKHFDGSEIEQGEVITWNRNKYEMLKQNDSYVAKCGIAVLDSLENTTSKEAFIKNMEKEGWTTTWTDRRKHITFKNIETGEKVRGSNLFKTFKIDATKEGLTHEFERQKKTEREFGEYYKQLERVEDGLDREASRDNRKVEKRPAERTEEESRPADRKRQTDQEMLNSGRLQRRKRKAERGEREAERGEREAEQESWLSDRHNREAEQERLRTSRSQTIDR